jgi:predicted phage tail protein
VIPIECDASKGPISASVCVFYDITNGSNAQPCSVADYAANAAASSPASTCVSESGDTTGIMEINSQPEYGTFQGFGFASGLGSINAAALIDAVQGNTAPSGLAASADGQTVMLTWAVDANATLGYDVYEGAGPGQVSSTPVQQNIMGTSTTISGLQFGQQYAFTIAAVSASGVSPQSSEVAVMTVPAAPTGLQVAASGAGALTLTWTASSGASTYSVFEGTTAGGESTSPVTTGVQSQSTTITSLAPGQQYFFTVGAIDSGGSSAPSTEASGTVVAAIPGGVTATAGNGSVSLSWTPVAGASSYNIYMSMQSNGESAQPQQTAAMASATVAGLGNGTTYYFTVAAVDAGGTSAPSSQVSATPTAPPSTGGGGGGTMDWLALAVLAFLAAFQRGRAGFLAMYETKGLKLGINAIRARFRGFEYSPR